MKRKTMLVLIAVLCAFALVLTGCGKDEEAPETKAAEIVTASTPEEEITLGLTGWELDSTTWSSPNGATVHITATPASYSEGLTADFVVRLEGADVITVPCQWDGAAFTGSAELNAEDGYCYYVILSSGGHTCEVPVNIATEPVDETLVNMATALNTYCTLLVEDSEAAEGKLTLTYKEYDNATRADKNYGYFFITRVDIIPEANQIQLVLRYNNSTISSLKKDYGLEKEPAREEDLFDLTLVSVTDLTPENKNDNAAKDFDPEVMKKTRYFPTESYTVSDQKNMYNYRKFVFEDVPIEELTLALYVDIYYNEDINYENDAYGTLCIWDYLAYDRSHELTANDIKALENWRKK